MHYPEFTRWTRFAWLSILMLPTLRSAAELAVYPGADPSLACDIFEVRVGQDGAMQKAFVYQSKSDWDTQTYYRHKKFYDTLSYAGFAFAGPVTVEVTKVNPVRPGIPEMPWRPGITRPDPPTAVVVRPERLGIRAELDGWTARFTIDRPGQYSVEFVDRDLDPLGAPLHGIMIFADPPEDASSVPNLGDPEVCQVNPGQTMSGLRQSQRTVAFAAGVHDIGPWVVPDHVRQVYLAPGAFVKGTVSVTDTHGGFVLNGRGILSAHHMGWHAKAPPGEEAGWYEVPGPGKDYLKLLIINGDDFRVDGIVLADSPFHTVGASGERHHWSWAKVIGWRYNNDGIPGLRGSLIEHCFIRANDDAIWLYKDDMTVRDLVMWQGDNGACFQLGWNSKLARNIVVRDIDIIHAEWGLDQRHNNSGVANIVLTRTGEDGPQVQENILFENIFVDTPVASGIDIRLRKGDIGYGAPHRLKGFTFRNVHLQLVDNYPWANNYLIPWDDSYGIEDFIFENVRVNGVLVTESNYNGAGRFLVAPDILDEVRFVADTTLMEWENPVLSMEAGSGTVAAIHHEGAFYAVAGNREGGLSVWKSHGLDSWERLASLSPDDVPWGQGPLAEPTLATDPLRTRLLSGFKRSGGFGVFSLPSGGNNWILHNRDQPVLSGIEGTRLFVDGRGRTFLLMNGPAIADLNPQTFLSSTDFVPLGRDGSNPFILQRGGRFHLMYESGTHQGTMEYAVGGSVWGPFVRAKSQFLISGTVGQSAFTGPDGRAWIAVARLGEESVRLHLCPQDFDWAASLFPALNYQDQCTAEVPQ